MRWRLRLSVMLICLLLSRPASGASVLDWLTFQPGADQAHFRLLDDAGVQTLQGEVQIVSGLLAPLSPAAGILPTPFWVNAPDFTDSATGDATVATTRVQIAPQAGLVHYRLTLTGTNLAGMTFGLGQLFGSGSGGTRLLNIAARNAGGNLVPVNPLGFHAWDDGIRLFTQGLNWDAALQQVSLASDAGGESGFLFLSVPTGGVSVTQLSFEIPAGHTGAVGDALEFAFAIPAVPEPGAGALPGAGGCMLAVGRRFRRTATPAGFVT